eukprot:366244-Chlamydomonas_euryale.AAC.7
MTAPSHCPCCHHPGGCSAKPSGQPAQQSPHQPALGWREQPAAAAGMRASLRGAARRALGRHLSQRLHAC